MDPQPPLLPRQGQLPVGQQAAGHTHTGIDEQDDQLTIDDVEADLDDVETILERLDAERS